MTDRVSIVAPCPVENGCGRDVTWNGSMQMGNGCGGSTKWTILCECNPAPTGFAATVQRNRQARTLN